MTIGKCGERLFGFFTGSSFSCGKNMTPVSAEKNMASVLAEKT